MALTSNDIANEALLLIGGNQPVVTGQNPTWDDSTAGKALTYLYTPAFRAVLRTFGYDFARSTVALVLSGNVAPFPYALEYAYPSQGVEVGAIFTAADDVLNPLPYNYSVGNAVVSGTQQRVIWAEAALVNAICRFTNQPTEATIDDLFHQSFVRLLASALVMAIAGKPDVAQGMLASGDAFERLAETRQD